MRPPLVWREINTDLHAAGDYRIETDSASWWPSVIGDRREMIAISTGWKTLTAAKAACERHWQGGDHG